MGASGAERRQIVGRWPQLRQSGAQKSCNCPVQRKARTLIGLFSNWPFVLLLCWAAAAAAAASVGSSLKSGIKINLNVAAAATGRRCLLPERPAGWLEFDCERARGRVFPLRRKSVLLHERRKPLAGRTKRVYLFFSHLLAELAVLPSVRPSGWLAGWQTDQKQQRWLEQKLEAASGWSVLMASSLHSFISCPRSFALPLGRTKGLPACLLALKRSLDAS